MFRMEQSTMEWMDITEGAHARGSRSGKRLRGLTQLDSGEKRRHPQK